jgi:hypothetical protein
MFLKERKEMRIKNKKMKKDIKVKKWGICINELWVTPCRK